MLHILPCSSAGRASSHRRAGSFPALGAARRAGATALLGVGFFLVGVGLVVVDTVRLRGDDAIDAILVAGVLTCGLAGWRWGSPVFAGLSGVALFGYLGRLPHGRVLWLSPARC